MLEISLNLGSVSEMQHLGDRLVFGALRASLGWTRSFLRTVLSCHSLPMVPTVR